MVSGQWAKNQVLKKPGFLNADQRFKVMKKTLYVFQKNYRSYEDFVDAVDDICSDCQRENCGWYKLQTSFKVWKKSKIKYFACDRFLEVKEIGKDKRNGKGGEGTQLDFDFLSGRG